MTIKFLIAVTYQLQHLIAMVMISAGTASEAADSMLHQGFQGLKPSGAKIFTAFGSCGNEGLPCAWLPGTLAQWLRYGAAEAKQVGSIPAVVAAFEMQAASGESSAHVNDL